MKRNVSLLAECPSHEDEQGYDEGAEHGARNDDVFPHFQSLFQLPFFQISQVTNRSPIRTSKMATNSPASHVMHFPIHESKTSDCRARELR